jgi:pyrimidine deaminase RibD-like protein
MSNLVDRAMNETVELRRADGTVQPVRALVLKDSIMIADTKLRVSEGDVIKRSLPSGLSEEYEIDHVEVNHGLRGRGAHIMLTVSKLRRGISAGAPPDVTQAVETSDDRKFAQLAIDVARKSISESDGRPHPNVGAVVVKNGQLLSTAYRGEAAKNHAEFIALEKKLPDSAVAGATIYTTLEPCTTRNHPKIPCAERLIERKVARVVIGMLDPDPRITGRGQRRLRSANIITDFFPHDLMTEVEELNREFTRFVEQNHPKSD